VSAEEKRRLKLIYYGKKYDKYRETILAHRKLKYVPIGRSVGMPRLERD
jgi:hypothetical protein